MVENFSDLFEQSQQTLQMSIGSIIKAQVVKIERDFVIVNAGLKSEAFIPREQFVQGASFQLQEGDWVDVAIEAVEDGFGETRLSRERAKRMEVWQQLIHAHEHRETLQGLITARVKGGFTVEFDGVRAFLPGSLVDVRPVRDAQHIEGKLMEFKVIKIDPKRNNIVVSHRAVLEEGMSADREVLLGQMEEGQEYTGTVKNITDYGAFIDLGGVDGLLHITDMSWKRIRHPSEMLKVGDEIRVRVLRYDRDRQRVSLGIKQLGDDPWMQLARRYPQGSRLTGRVTNITDYGCFVELEEGVEGLVHVSEMDWVSKNVHPSKVVQLGQTVEVMVLDLDEERRRISLGLKQCKANPWQTFAASHQKGDEITGKVKSVTDFGLFIGLPGNIDGLIHLSDLSWNDSGEELLKNYKKGDDVRAVVLSIDSDRERISLGVRQLTSDGFSDYTASHQRGSVVKGTVKSVDAKGATVLLSDGVEAYLRASDLQKDRVDDASTVLKVGDEIEAKVVNVDKKSRNIQLSIKALEQAQDAEALAEHAQRSQEAMRTTLGDLFHDED